MPGHLVDSCVLLDVAKRDPHWLAWSAQAICYGIDHGGIGMNPLIFAEISVGYASRMEAEAALPELDLTRWSLPWDAAFLAGKAFQRYRADGGMRRSPLPDFSIGAHALVAGMTLITRDVRRYRRHFPRLSLIAPDTHFTDLVPA